MSENTEPHRVKYCSDYDGAPGMPRCCDSCHDDEEAGYNGLLEKYNADGVLTHMVCCAVYTWLADKDV